VALIERAGARDLVAARGALASIAARGFQRDKDLPVELDSLLDDLRAG